MADATTQSAVIPILAAIPATTPLFEWDGTALLAEGLEDGEG